MATAVGSGLLGVTAGIDSGVAVGVGVAVNAGRLNVGADVASAITTNVGVAVAICVGATVGALSTGAGVSPVPEHANKTATTTPTANVEE